MPKYIYMIHTGAIYTKLIFRQYNKFKLNYSLIIITIILATMFTKKIQLQWNGVNKIKKIRKVVSIWLYKIVERAIKI